MALLSAPATLPRSPCTQEDTVRASWTEQSPSTPSAYAVSLFDSVRTKGRRSVASTESSDVAPTEARKSRGDEGSGTDPSAATLDLEVVGTWADLPAATRASRPYLSGCLALRLPASASPALLRGMLQGQVALSAVDSSGALVRSTGVQLPGALDALCAYDGHLGAFVDRATNHVTISVWAPTALSVRILLFRGPRDPEPFHAAPMQPGAKGAWHARGPAEGRGSWDRAYYQFEVRAYHPATGAVEDMVTTDPYARACSADGERSLVVHQDMRDPDLTPQGWGESEPRAVDRPTDAVIYELHVRDFSATDPTVPEDARGKFLAFTLPGARRLAARPAARRAPASLIARATRICAVALCTQLCRRLFLVPQTRRGRATSATSTPPASRTSTSFPSTTSRRCPRGRPTAGTSTPRRSRPQGSRRPPRCPRRGWRRWPLSTRTTGATTPCITWRRRVPTPRTRTAWRALSRPGPWWRPCTR